MMKLFMMILKIVMPVTIKMKMIFLHFDNHKNASKILLQLFIKLVIFAKIVIIQF